MSINQVKVLSLLSKQLCSVCRNMWRCEQNGSHNQHFFFVFKCFFPSIIAYNCSLIMRYYQTGVTFDLFLLQALTSSTSGWKSCSAPSTCHTCPWVAQQAEHEAEWKAAESDFNTQEIEQTWNMTWTHFSRYSVEGISKQSHSERLMIDRALYMHTHWISCKRTGQEDILGYFPGKCIRSSCSSMSALDAQEPIAWLQQGFRSQTVFRCF